MGEKEEQNKDQRNQEDGDEDTDEMIERTDCCDILIRKLFPQIDHFCWCPSVNLRTPVLGIAYWLGFAHLALLTWNYILLSGALHVGERSDSLLGISVDPIFYGTLHTICFVFSIILVIGVHSKVNVVPKIWVVVTLVASVLGILYYIIKNTVVFSIGCDAMWYTIATSIMYTLFYGTVFYFMAVVKSYYVECAEAEAQLSKYPPEQDKYDDADDS